MQNTPRANQVWSKSDKRKLHELLQALPLTAYTNIASRLKTKTAEQVQTYIETLKHSVSVNTDWKKEKDKRPIPKAPIEEWIDLTQSLVMAEDADLSAQLGQVMSIISHLESFPESKSDRMQPNYPAIYRYLSQLLNGQELDEIGPLESALLLEIFHSLMEVLSGADTSVQRNIMRWKYQLINTRASSSLRKVVENDFSDFLNDDTILVEVDTLTTGTPYASQLTSATPQHVPITMPAPHRPASTVVDSQDFMYTASDISVPATTDTATSQPGSTSSTLVGATPFIPRDKRPPPEPKVEYVLVMPPKHSTVVTEAAKSKKASASDETPVPLPEQPTQHITIGDPNQIVSNNTTKVKEAISRKLKINVSKKNTSGDRADKQVPCKEITSMESSKTVQNTELQTGKEAEKQSERPPADVGNDKDKAQQNNDVQGTMNKTVQQTVALDGNHTQEKQANGSPTVTSEKQLNHLTGTHAQPKERETMRTVTTVTSQSVSNVNKSATAIHASTETGRPNTCSASTSMGTTVQASMETSRPDTASASTETSRPNTSTSLGTSTSAQTYSMEEEQHQQLSQEKKEAWKRKLVSAKSKPGKSLKKPKLYSLNPLCIPVSLLDLA